MITVHHLAHSRSQRVLWLLEELGVPYEVKRYERLTPTKPIAPPELKKIHPLGKSPVIIDGKYTIAETGAIFDYLLETYGKGELVPASEDDRIQFRYWLHYAEGSAMPPLVMRRIIRAVPENAPALLRPLVRVIMEKLDQGYIGDQIAMHLGYCDEALSKTGWFAGHKFSAADIMMSLPLEIAHHRADVKPFAHIRDFVTRIHALPTYQAALKRGGDYMYA